MSPLDQLSDEIPDSLKQFADPADKPVADDKKIEVADDKNIEIEHKPDPISEKASKLGHVSKEEWIAAGKDEDAWVDAGEFVRREPLFKELKTLKRALKDRDEKIDKVSQHAARIEENTRKKVIAELEEKRTQAVEVGDVEAFKHADKALEEVRAAPVIEPTKEEIPQSVQEFAERNQRWFEKDPEMTQFAVDRTGFHRKAGVSLEQALINAEADVKRFYADKFVNPNKEKPGAVLSSNNGERRGKTYGLGDLNQEQKDVWHVLKRSGKTLDSYISELKELGDLK